MAKVRKNAEKVSALRKLDEFIMRTRDLHPQKDKNEFSKIYYEIFKKGEIQQ